jgi:hypothetical protein
MLPMKIIDEDLLNDFRTAPCCEWCKKKNRGGLQPHHIFSRGMGGSSRLDVAINLTALCAICHRMVHDGHIARFDLLAIVAVREGMMQDKIEEEIYRLQRLKKEDVA